MTSNEPTVSISYRVTGDDERGLYRTYSVPYGVYNLNGARDMDEHDAMMEADGCRIDTTPAPIVASSDGFTYGSMIMSVWSGYGHRFMSTGEGTDSSCLTCGAIYREDENGDPRRGRYVTNGGDEPMPCTGDTEMAHGYERVCQDGDGTGCDESKTSDDGTCTHTAHDCNCLFCD